MTKVKKGKRQRAYRPKTQSGCLTCRIRRVKCDEGVPACLRCTSTGRNCDGYAYTTTPTAPVPILKWPSLEIQGCPRSKRSFSFFVQRTCSQLAGFFGSDFWERLILQAAYHEPAVRHAIVAIGSRHELAKQQTEKIDAVEVFALGQYNLAIKNLLNPTASKDQRSTDIYLILSILFACFENIQGNHALAITHIQSGVKLLRETVYDKDTGALHHQLFGATNRTNSYASLEAYAKIFAFQDSQASMIIGDYQRLFLETSPLYADQVYGDSPLSFSSINEAKSIFEQGACLFSGTLDAKLAEDSVQLPHAPMERQRSHLANLMSKFYLAVQELVQSKRSYFTPKEELAAAVLQLNVLVTWVSFEIELRCPNASWDEFMPQLEEMIILGEKIVSFISSSDDSGEETNSFCPESGYVIPMYAVASNSRDLGIRRRAIAVLRSVSRQEGLWNSILVAKAAERVVEIEEIYLREVYSCAEALEPLESFGSRPLLKIDAKGGRLHYIMNVPDDHIPRDVVEEVFNW
ncbi:hypothetical protein F5Y09DRAFT_357297 [Xylaria sp. FL1042]|nr:hypothetical protein F5Y09DRAFT_357297 [Xylaria sp. FL1042]